MTSNETVLDLIKRYVLADGEDIEQVHNWSDGLALTTNRRHFVAGSEPDQWTVSREPWAADVVVAVRDDLLTHGSMQRFGFLLLSDGSDISLNDEHSVAQLGTRLIDGMDPLGYAEILVEFHPHSSAFRAVLSESDELRRLFSQPELPDVGPIQLERTAHGVICHFSSFARYARTLGSLPLLDISEWTVEVPAGVPARWTSKRVITGIRLGPGQVARDAS